MDHFAPHPASQFEGFYSKFDLPSGGHVALIICSIPKAPKRAHMVSFTYTPKSSKTYFQREIWADEINMTRLSGDDVFELDAVGIGSMTVKKDSTTTYHVKHPDFTFSATTETHRPWSSSAVTPEGLLVHLPLPLHWHVHTVASECKFDLTIPSFADLLPEDRHGLALVHQEKNWANSFPSAHMWVQARLGRPPDASAPQSSTETPSKPQPFRSICIAGGKILGTEAYLLGYRSNTHPAAKKSPGGVFELDFKPPSALRLLKRSPTLSIESDFEKRSFKLSAHDWWSRIDVEAQAPANTFFPLSSPFPDGHRENFLAESFDARIKVTVWRWWWGRNWWDVLGWVGAVAWTDVGIWVKEEEVEFENGSLEFGGGYYAFAGSETRRGR